MNILVFLCWISVIRIRAISNQSQAHDIHTPHKYWNGSRAYNHTAATANWASKTNWIHAKSGTDMRQCGKIVRLRCCRTKCPTHEVDRLMIHMCVSEIPDTDQNRLLTLYPFQYSTINKIECQIMLLKMRKNFEQYNTTIKHRFIQLKIVQLLVHIVCRYIHIRYIFTLLASSL